MKLSHRPATSFAVILLGAVSAFAGGIGARVEPARLAQKLHALSNPGAVPDLNELREVGFFAEEFAPGDLRAEPVIAEATQLAGELRAKAAAGEALGAMDEAKLGVVSLLASRGFLHEEGTAIRDLSARLGPKMAEIASALIGSGVVVDEQGAAERLAKGLTFKTISNQDRTQFPAEEFGKLREHIERSFPRVHATLTKELVNGHSLLYTWKGTDPSLKPMMMIAHQDVVPVEPGTEGRWTHPPFGGVIADGIIWGRGAVDYKGGVFGMLEAVESLLAQGYQPKRTLYLGFGHDEEVGGFEGDAKLAQVLRERGVKLSTLIDEGGSISIEKYPGIDKPVASVALAEKGYATIELTAKAPGGHSARPSPRTAIGTLSRAIAKLEANPFPHRLTGTVRKTLAALAPELPLPQRVAYSDPDFYWTLVDRQLSEDNYNRAMLHTTQAPTMVNAGVKENVIPTSAKALVNFRILAGDSVESVLARVKELVKEFDVAAELAPGSIRHEASPETSTSGPAFEAVKDSIASIFPGSLFVPALMTAFADNRHYSDFTDNIYRFVPAVVKASDASMIHGTNERVTVANYADFARFYALLIRNLNK